MEHEELTREIIGGGMKVHRVLGPGFVESVYKNALAYELRSRGLRVEREKKLRVYYEDFVVGDFSADMFVEETIIVESKAVRTLAPGHEVQLVSYLTAIKHDTGLLLNFGGERLQFRRKTRVYQPRKRRQ
jgi:GxxExxY protein